MLYLPGYLTAANEPAVLAELARARPAAVVLWRRPVSEYDRALFGEDYGRSIRKWIDENYRLEGFRAAGAPLRRQPRFVVGVPEAGVTRSPATGRSRAVAALALAAVGAATIALYVVSRGKWTDAIIDIGSEWMWPDALARGDVLYRDVVYWFGPFTLYLHAGFFRLFGSSFATLALAGVVASALTLVVLRACLRLVTGRIESLLWTALAIPLLVFMRIFGRRNPRHGLPHVARGGVHARRVRRGPDRERSVGIRGRRAL
jgi:hypothetical protein